MPVEKSQGDKVFGATLNRTGAFRFRATRVGRHTALQQIVRMVQQAQGSRAHRAPRGPHLGRVRARRALPRDRRVRGVVHRGPGGHAPRLGAGRGGLGAEAPPQAADVARLRKRLDELAAIDFFAAPGGPEAAARVVPCERRVRGEAPAAALEQVDRRSLVGRLWVTRGGIHVDRIATAWLVRCFIDAEARFAFVAKNEAPPAPDALRFDMFGGEFMHEGDRCSFEVLAAKTGIADPAVDAIGEVIHDLDLKDGRFGRPETAGVGAAIAGICWAEGGDEARLRAGSVLLDALYEYYRRRAGEQEVKP